MKTFLLRKLPVGDSPAVPVVMLATVERTTDLWSLVDELDDPLQYEYAMAVPGLFLAAGIEIDPEAGAVPAGQVLEGGISASVLFALDDDGDDNLVWAALATIRPPAGGVRSQIQADAAPAPNDKDRAGDRCARAEAEIYLAQKALSASASDLDRLHAVFLLSGLAQRCADMAKEVLSTMEGSLGQKQAALKDYVELQRDLMRARP